MSTVLYFFMSVSSIIYAIYLRLTEGSAGVFWSLGAAIGFMYLFGLTVHLFTNLEYYKYSRIHKKRNRNEI